MLLSVAMLIIAAGNEWMIQITPNDLNVGVQVETACRDRANGKLNFLAVDYVPVEPEWDRVNARRQLTLPANSRCEVSAFTIRNPNGATGDPKDDYTAESSSTGA